MSKFIDVRHISGDVRNSLDVQFKTYLSVHTFYDCEEEG
jgi:hypothetical protein